MPELNTFTGKLAFATNDGVSVAGHPGRCKAFMIYELNNGVVVNKELRENTFTHHRASGAQEEQHGHTHEENHQGHSHQSLIDALKDCSFFIAKMGGWRIVEDLKNNNITPLFTSIEIIESAVEMFIKAELKNNDELVCHHH
jgi:predicted Fe-Mo cluster-binding NifX family protein